MRLKHAAFLVGVFSLLAAQSAFSADLPAKAPVYKAPIVSATPWTGFYVNGGFGYGLWNADQTTDFPGGGCFLCDKQVEGGKGWLGTIGAGYDYQFTSRIVGGVFGDASLTSLKGTIQDRGSNGSTGDIKQTSSWAVGARAGWLVTPQTMSYINAGYANAHFSGTDMVTFFSGVPTGVSTPSFNASGWFLGGGMETSVMPGWFVRTEYRYNYYGNKLVVETPNNFNINFKPTVQTVTAQLVYKFNGGLAAPVYPAMPVTPTNWTGFYLNGGIGYGMWAAGSGENNPGTSTCSACVTQIQGGKGWLGTIGAGYDYQFSPMFVAGVFGDATGSSLKGTLQDQQSGSWGDIKQKAAWTVGPRFGWLPSPQTMTYVNGGYASARFNGTNFINPNPTGFTSASFTTNGWFVGGGVETTFDFFGMLGKGWFWRNEYRYASYGSKTLPSSNGILVVEDITFKPVVQTVTSEIVFKFN